MIGTSPRHRPNRPLSLELRELLLPEIGPDDALLQVEACGICGTDYEQYEGALAVSL